MVRYFDLDLLGLSFIRSPQKSAQLNSRGKNNPLGIVQLQLIQVSLKRNQLKFVFFLY